VLDGQLLLLVELARARPFDSHKPPAELQMSRGKSAIRNPPPLKHEAGQ
jgi:hypothetical protein